MSEALRRIPCRQCGYQLRGRRIGEQCPECGWLIDAAGPAWCTKDDLRRLRRAAPLAWIPCAALLVVPVLAILSIVASTPEALGATLLVFLALLPVQLVAQAVGVWQISSTEIGPLRRRRLRAWTVARLAAFALGALILGLDATGAVWRGLPAWFEISAYFAIPLVAVAADALMVRTLASLAKEARVVLPGSYAVLPPMARVALWIVYPLILVPLIGWFLAPILWAVSMAICLRQVGRLAEECERAFVEGRGELL